MIFIFEKYDYICIKVFDFQIQIGLKYYLKYTHKHHMILDHLYCINTIKVFKCTLTKILYTRLQKRACCTTRTHIILYLIYTTVMVTTTITLYMWHVYIAANAYYGQPLPRYNRCVEVYFVCICFTRLVGMDTGGRGLRPVESSPPPHQSYGSK